MYVSSYRTGLVADLYHCKLKCWFCIIIHNNNNQFITELLYYLLILKYTYIYITPQVKFRAWQFAKIRNNVASMPHFPLPSLPHSHPPPPPLYLIRVRSLLLIECLTHTLISNRSLPTPHNPYWRECSKVPYYTTPYHTIPHHTTLYCAVLQCVHCTYTVTMMV
jgi:hypothetical protein